jgi:exonuclease VII small subunit
MRRFADWFLLVSAVIAAAWQWYAHGPEILSALRMLRLRVFPCSTPITYTIGAIDLGYTLTREELAEFLREAETAWEGPARKDLFEFTASSADVTVNMVYDSRQASLDKLKTLGIQADQSLGSYSALKKRYEELTAQVDLEQAKLKEVIARYKAGEAAYNATVLRWNKRGGAPPADAKRVKARKAELAREFEWLKKVEGAVNKDVDTLNALATTLNQLIVELNLSVEQYNRAGASIGRYQEGLHKVTKGVQSIDVYKYTTRPTLVRLLAHEMGHSLGLEHTEDVDSLMYPVNRGDSLKLTAKDIKELLRACKSGL